MMTQKKRERSSPLYSPSILANSGRTDMKLRAQIEERAKLDQLVYNFLARPFLRAAASSKVKQKKQPSLLASSSIMANIGCMDMKLGPK